MFIRLYHLSDVRFVFIAHHGVYYLKIKKTKLVVLHKHEGFGGTDKSSTMRIEISLLLSETLRHKTAYGKGLSRRTYNQIVKKRVNLRQTLEK